MREPDFLGLGALRCGVVWWRRLVFEHPLVTRPSEHSGLFFSRFAGEELTDADVEAYLARFRPAPGALTGDWPARALSDPWVPPLLARIAPRAKLLVLLRDPIERYLTALAEQGEDPEHRDVQMAQIVAQGRYGSQLRALLEFFPREQLLVLQQERCRADVAGQLARTLRFLEVPDPDFLPQEAHVAPKGLPRVKPWKELSGALHDLYDEEVALTQELVGDDLDLSLWPNFGP